MKNEKPAKGAKSEFMGGKAFVLEPLLEQGRHRRGGNRGQIPY